MEQWPNAEAAEIEIIAQAMQFPQEALGWGLEPSEFYDRYRGQVYGIILDLARQGAYQIREQVLADELEKRGILPQNEALELLIAWGTGEVDLSTFRLNIERIKETALQRRYLVLASDIARLAGKGGEGWLDKIHEKYEALKGQTLQANCDACDLTDVADFFGNVTWVWKPWLPVGHVTLIAGPQGVGKSYLTARLMASLTGVMPWPDNTPTNDGGTVLLAETEEFRGEYATRLRRFGVPDSAVILPGAEPTYLPNIIEDATMIYGLAQRYGCRSIVVDSLSGGHLLDENSAEMRKALRVLTGLAAGLRVPVIAVHHPRKRSQFESAALTLERIRGSSVITQFCRSVIGLWQPEEGPGKPVRVESLKNSFGPPPKPFGFQINDGGLEFGDAPEEPKAPTAVDRAIEFLRVELREKPKRFGELLEAAEAEGISKDSLYRARRALKVVSTNGFWGLPVLEGIAHAKSEIEEL